MQVDLSSQQALVTGASRGIGRAIALALGAAGANVVGTATSEDGAAAISAYMQENTIAGRGAVLNTADAASIDALLTDMKAAMPTILVNNAAITRDNLLMRMNDDEWDSVIQTNLTGVFRLCKACIRPMMKAKGGRIINISSVVGLTGNPGQANYVATKAGIIGFTKSLAKEIGSRGITANAIAPGFIDTDMTKALPEEQRAMLLQNIPLGRAGLPDDIANAVLFLASPAAAYITGETIHVNGGMYMA
jgi:3-oxoacyl-[acyl-carrier protein] reductase